MNKLITLSISILFLSSCSGLKELTYIPPSKVLYGIDFTPFTKKGFLITPEKYAGIFESVGLIDYSTKPGANYKLSGREPNPNYEKQGGDKYFEIYKWKVDSIQFSDALNEVYKICTDMGADAIMNFKNELVLMNIKI
jgi:hypothetical protein